MLLKKGRRDMKKSVYSVVLSDNVISEIDKLAYINGTNRSNMINQILAEYVSLITPEKRIQNVFDELSSLLFVKDDFKLMNPPSHSSLSFVGAFIQIQSDGEVCCGAVPRRFPRGRRNKGLHAYTECRAYFRNDKFLQALDRHRGTLRI